MIFRALLAATLVGALVVGLPSSAHAQDSDAPPGAPAHWLPAEEWVDEHWLPYEQARLHQALGTDPNAIRAWLRPQRATLGDLARSKGKDPRQVLGQLLEPWRGRVSQSQYALLQSRAERTFNQPHLAQHMLFHLFHHKSLNSAWPRILGVGRPEMVRERSAGLSFVDIGRRRGRSAEQIRAQAISILRTVAQKGVRTNQMSDSQAQAWIALQEAKIAEQISKSGAGGMGGAHSHEMHAGALERTLQVLLSPRLPAAGAIFG